MNGWNYKIERTAKNLCLKSGIYRIMHDESSNYYGKIHNILSIASISIVTLTATSYFSTIMLKESIVYQVIIGLILYSIGFITALKDFLNPTQVSEKHKLYSIRFAALYHNIQRQLLLDVCDRQNGSDYIGWVNSEFDNLLFSNPDIPSKIKKKRTLELEEVLDIGLPESTIGYENYTENDIELGNLHDENDIETSRKNENSKIKWEIERYMQST